MTGSATRALRVEHRIILDVLRALDTTLAGEPTSARLTPFVDFLRGYVDYCHHRKEELCLFPLLETHGMGGVVDLMREEHAAGRDAIARLERAIAQADAAAAVAAGTTYIDLLRAHIEKEDSMVFASVDAAMDAGDLAQLSEAFASVESASAYRENFERCSRFAMTVATRQR